jgi:WW domain-binding protein 2
MFGSNYLYFEIKPSSGGGLTDGTNVELRFKNRAMFEFVALLEKTRERAIYMKRQAAQAEDEDGLRAFSHLMVLFANVADDIPYFTATYTLPEESRTVTLVNGVPVENPPEYGSS